MSDDTSSVDRVKTPIGELLMVANARGALRMLDSATSRSAGDPRFTRRFDGARIHREGEIAFGSRQDAQALFRRRNRQRSTTIEADAQGTDFQRACWKNLRKIPAGTTTSYGALAKKIGKPAAMRAVGLANGQTRSPLSCLVIASSAAMVR